MRKVLKALVCVMICVSFITTLPLAYAGYLYGDINGDGTVSTDDAILVLRVATGLEVLSGDQQSRADMDKDGVISTEDARLVLVEAVSPNTDEAYIEYLMEQGFPKSYTEPLLELHKKYPTWKFEPFITGLTWSAAVTGERTPHNKQLIENVVQDSYKCSCSTCKGVIQEASNWVSASQTAVEYYLDPRNFLNEQYIFQFESTEYNDSQTLSAVEVILKSTWMYNSNITYVDANGNTCTYLENKKPLKYSEAILRAAKDHNMSAYYLASKIVQEVGSSAASNAGGSSGTCSPYNGIYNYYNIGANTGALDGLKWASSSGSYGRPWDNPYKTIYYGAEFIYNSFSKYQFTGYLQKFNVNANSGMLYTHEYMANVRAAASESYHTYKAYSECGILESTKVFSIPVFINMPGGNLSALERFQSMSPIAEFDSSTAGSVTIGWGEMDDADGYQVWKLTGGSFSLLSTTSANKYTDTTVKSGNSATYKVRAYQKLADGTYAYSQYSPEISVVASPGVPSGLKVTARTETTITLSWTASSCDGYNIYRTDGISKEYALVGTTTSASFTDKNLLPGIRYTYRIKAYHDSDGNIAVSSASSAVNATTSGTANVTIGTVKVNDALNIRNAPSTSGGIITTLPNAQRVFVLDTTDGWCKVNFISNGTVYTGYASATYLSISEYTTTSSCPYTEPTSTVSQGNSGDSVKWVQWYLASLGYLDMSGVDGVFGSGTLAAVKSFQSDAGITVDGLVGSGTRAALKSALGG